MAERLTKVEIDRLYGYENLENGERLHYPHGVGRAERDLVFDLSEWSDRIGFGKFGDGDMEDVPLGDYSAWERPPLLYVRLRCHRFYRDFQFFTKPGSHHFNAWNCLRGASHDVIVCGELDDRDLYAVAVIARTPLFFGKLDSSHKSFVAIRGLLDNWLSQL